MSLINRESNNEEVIFIIMYVVSSCYLTLEYFWEFLMITSFIFWSLMKFWILCNFLQLKPPFYDFTAYFLWIHWMTHHKTQFRLYSSSIMPSPHVRMMLKNLSISMSSSTHILTLSQGQTWNIFRTGNSLTFDIFDSIWTFRTLHLLWC